MITKRLFGSALDGKVRNELERRQHQKRNEDNVLESLGDSTSEYNLGERTPFVRMWTSLKFISPELIQETLKTYNKDDKEGASAAYSRANEYSRTNPVTKVKAVLDENKKITGYAVYDPRVRDQIDYAKQTYIVGDYNYQQKYGESLEKQSNIKIFDTSQKKLSKDLFPRLLKTNPLNKPQAGITSVSSETQEFLGTIKKTTVNFVVHNFYDFDKIYNRYFLKPGATIFIDFGWSDIKSLYEPDKLIDSNNILDFLYDDEVGQITQNPHKLEVIQGIVVDYSSKILENGSVECSLTIQSSNSALSNQALNEKKVRQVQDILTNGARYLGIIPTLKRIGGGEENEDLKNFYITPNMVKDFGSIATFEKNLLIKSEQILSSDGMTPEGNPVRTGVYVSSLDVQDVYVSIGFFEDIVINERFGFGKSIQEIQNGKNLNVRMNSSDSFTSFSENFLKRQQTVQSTDSAPVFLYPKSWGDDLITPLNGSTLDPNGDAEQGIGSYNFQQGKFPSNGYETDSQAFPHTTQDKDKKRIPIRELFINCETIITAFTEEDNVQSAIKEILSKINTDSDNLFNLSLVGGGEGVGNELRIVDNHKIETLEKILESGEDVDRNPIYFKDMFTFNIMSPNSIVKSYDLEFKLPTSQIGTMYAIQAMGNENSVYPADDILDDVVAMSSLDKDSLSIIYQPDMGGYRAEQISNEDAKDADLFNVYQNAKDLISSDVYDVAAVRESIVIPRPLPFSTNSDYKEYKNTLIEEPPLEKIDLIDQNNRKIVSDGDRVVTNLDDYYKKLIIKEEKVSIIDRPNLLPFSLSLTLYGISSIQPGDTFRVDYLPEIYKKNTFCQVMHVKHDVNSDGWFTTLETKFRPLPKIKDTIYKDFKVGKAYLSPYFLLMKYPELESNHFYTISNTKWTYGEPDYDKSLELDILRNNRVPITLNSILQYMTNIQVHPFNDYGLNLIDFICSFEVTDDVLNFKEMNDRKQPKWIGSYKYEVPKKNYRVEGTGLSIGYNFKKTEYTPAKGALNGKFHYQPWPIQFKPGNTLYFVHHKNGAGYFTNQEGVKKESLKQYDKVLSSGYDYNVGRRSLSSDEIIKHKMRNVDYMNDPSVQRQARNKE